MSTSSSSQQLTKFIDMLRTLELGSLKNDSRIQVKIPSAVVKELDKLYPKQNRSKLFTKLALSAIIEKHRFADSLELSSLVAAEQAGLNEMWAYLEEREND